MSIHRSMRSALLLVVVLGAVLRLYPVHQSYWHPELQEHYPHDAVAAIVRHDWRPSLVHNGAALFDSLRLIFAAWYGVGWLSGAYHDRLDLLASFLTDPFPFVVAGRLIIACCALIALCLVGALGARLGGPGAGIAAAFLSAVTLVDVRAAHHVWPDVPAAAATLAAVVAAMRVLDRPSTRRVLLAGAAAGLATACRLNAALALLAVLAACTAGVRGARRRVAGLVLSVVSGVSVFALLSPHTFLASRVALTMVGMESLKVVGPHGQSFSLATLLPLGTGWGMLLLALAGIVAIVRRRSLPGLVALVVPLAHLLALSPSSTVSARYLVLVTPFVAVVGACGAVSAVGWLRRWPRLAAPFMAGGLVLVAAFGPAVRSVRLDALLARDDTRRLAGRWILEHVPPGTPLTLPNFMRYPNPMLPRNRADLAWEYPEWASQLEERGLGNPSRTYPASYLGFLDTPTPGWEPRDRFVVTARHPFVLSGMNPPPAFIEKLHDARARPVAEFQGVREPLPAGVLYDQPDADYIPLTGFTAVTRPGPNIVIWELPR